jgi:excisionase family DNA binding protein
MKDLEKIDQRLGNIENLLLSQKTVLSFDEMAIYSGLSRSYLYKLTSSGGVPCYKPNGKQIYFSKPEVDQWLLQNRKATNYEIATQANTHLAIKKGGGK